MILDVDFPSIFDDQHWYFPDDSFDTWTNDSVAFDAVLVVDDDDDDKSGRQVEMEKLLNQAKKNYNTFIIQNLIPCEHLSNFLKL